MILSLKNASKFASGNVEEELPKEVVKLNGKCTFFVKNTAIRCRIFFLLL